MRVHSRPGWAQVLHHEKHLLYSGTDHPFTLAEGFFKAVKHRIHNPKLWARVAMEEISGRKKMKEIATDHTIHPIQASKCKRQPNISPRTVHHWRWSFKAKTADTLTSIEFAMINAEKIWRLLRRFIVNSD
jgi:hypothetical protein